MSMLKVTYADLSHASKYTKKAVEKNKDDSAWAYRYGKTDTLSDSLRLEGHHKAAPTNKWRHL